MPTVILMMHIKVTFTQEQYMFFKLFTSLFFFADPPSQPIGPLEFSDITHDSVSLSWQPPEDDGGCPITGYLVEYHDARRTTWMKAASVKADATSFRMSDLVEGNDYYFRVSAINAEGSSKPLESKETVTPQRIMGNLIFYAFWMKYLFYLDILVTFCIQC